MFIRKCINLGKQFSNMVYLAYSAKPLMGPLRISIALTYRCNSRCEFCSRWKAPLKKHEDELSTEEVKRIIEQFSEMGGLNLSFTGGEPFLRKDFFRLIRFAKDKGVCVITATTNGILMGKHIDDIINSGLSVLSVSLDGADKKTYKKLRGRDSFGQVIENISNLVKIRKKNRLKKPRVEINTVVNKVNYKQLPEIAELAKKLKVDSFNFGPINHLPQDGFITNDELLFTNKSEKKELENIITNLVNRKDLPLRAGKKFYNKIADFIFQPESTRKIPCWATHLTAFISHDGNIYPCCGRMTCFGNIRKIDIKSVWFSAKFQKIRKKVSKGDHDLCWMSCYAPFRYNFGSMIYEGLRFLKHLN